MLKFLVEANDMNFSLRHTVKFRS